MRVRMTAICVCAAGIAFWLLVSGSLLPANAREQWSTAERSRNWSFPGDHGSHRDFRTEWWYFTGSLASASDDFSGGFQLTFFRTGLKKVPSLPGNQWSVDDLYLAHFTLTDIPNNRFLWKERVSRTGPGLSGAADGDLKVWLNDWKAERTGSGIHLEARSGGMELDLTLVPAKPPVLHGSKGLSLKGSEPGQASWYYSMTGLETKGTLRLPGENSVAVEGKSWFDHEFGSNQLTEDQEGWDWFGLHLSDGTEVMIYIMRRKDGSLEPASSGTRIGTDGTPAHLELEDFSVKAIDRWKSPVSGGTYPSGWQVSIPKEKLEITVTPVLKNQELVTSATAGIAYWEGAVAIEGKAAGKDVTGTGYVELTGYAGSMGGIF